MARVRTEAFLQTLVSYLHWYISRRLSPADALNRARDHFGRIVNLYGGRAINLAMQSIQNADRANAIDPQSPLREALAGNAPPMEEVGVRVLITGRNSQNGEEMLGSQVVNATWDMTPAEIYQLALQQIRRQFRSWNDVLAPEFQIIGPLMFPHSTRQ